MFAQNISRDLQLPNTVSELLRLTNNPEVIQHFGTLSCTPMSCASAKIYRGESNSPFECPSTFKMATTFLFLDQSNNAINDQSIRLIFPGFDTSPTAVLYLVLYGILKNTFLSTQADPDKDVMRDLKHYAIRRLMTAQTTLDNFCLVTILAQFVILHVNPESIASLNDDEMVHLIHQHRENLELILVLVEILDIELGPKAIALSSSMTSKCEMTKSFGPV